MPIYEYVCRSCGKELEKLQKMSDAPLNECPECGESALKRKVSAAGFRLAGNGWYETDFKSDHRHNIADDKSGKSGNDKSANSGSTDGSSGVDSKPKSKPKTGAGSEGAATT